MPKQKSEHNKLSVHGQQRRTVLKGAGATLTMGALAANFGALLPRGVSAADSVIGSRCMTILYQNGDNINFNFDYYRDKHLTMIMDLYGNSIKRFELRKPVAAEGMPPPAYAAVVNFWVNDLAAFEAGRELREQCAQLAGFGQRIDPPAELVEIGGVGPRKLLD